MKETPSVDFIIKDKENEINMTLWKKETFQLTDTEGGNTSTERNQIEFSYWEKDADGWGFGSEEYISTSDVKGMAECVRKVIYKQQPMSEYSCQNDIFRIRLEYSELSDVFSFTAELINTATYESYISATKDKLTRNALDEYIQPFFEWERMFYNA